MAAAIALGESSRIYNYNMYRYRHYFYNSKVSFLISVHPDRADSAAPAMVYIAKPRYHYVNCSYRKSVGIYFTHVVFLRLDVHQWLGHVPSSLRHSRYVLVQQVLSGTGRGRRPTVVVVAARGRRHVVGAGRVAGLRGRAASEVWRTAKRKHFRSDYDADRSDFWGTCGGKVQVEWTSPIAETAEV